MKNGGMYYLCDITFLVTKENGKMECGMGMANTFGQTGAIMMVSGWKIRLTARAN